MGCSDFIATVLTLWNGSQSSTGREQTWIEGQAAVRNRSDVSRSRGHGPTTSLVPVRPSSGKRPRCREAGAPLAGMERAPLDLLLLQPLRHLVVFGKTRSVSAIASGAAVSQSLGDGQWSTVPRAVPVAVSDEEVKGLLVRRRSRLHDAAARSHHPSGSGVRSAAGRPCRARRIPPIIHYEEESRQATQHGR